MSLPVSIEAGPKKVFASAVDWPGWCRAGKTEELALAALVAYAERYATVVREVGLDLALPTLADLYVVDRVPGGAGTEFGVPSVVIDLDRRAVTAADAQRSTRILAAAWTILDRVVAGAPPELRKGPRGGGRDRDKVVAHVVESDRGYSRELGLKILQPDPADRDGVRAERAAILELLDQPSDGSPIGTRWPARYAARRIAWHALDHAWEIEDRSTPETP